MWKECSSHHYVTFPGLCFCRAWWFLATYFILPLSNQQIPVFVPKLYAGQGFRGYGLLTTFLRSQLCSLLSTLYPIRSFNSTLWTHLFQSFDSIQDDLDKLPTVQRKPPKPAKPVKPVAKPRLKPKPDLKPKPTPKPRFAEAGAAEDELFGTVSSTTKQERPVAKERKFPRGEQDLFDQARKQSFIRFASWSLISFVVWWFWSMGYRNSQFFLDKLIYMYTVKISMRIPVVMPVLITWKMQVVWGTYLGSLWLWAPFHPVQLAQGKTIHHFIAIKLQQKSHLIKWK